MLETEAQAIKRLQWQGITTADLFWARVDLGKHYLRAMYGERLEQKIQKIPAFWTWWRWVWHDNDVAILDWAIEEHAVLDWQDYLNAHRTKALRMEPPGRLLKDWSK